MVSHFSGSHVFQRVQIHRTAIQNENKIINCTSVALVGCYQLREEREEEKSSKRRKKTNFKVGRNLRCWEMPLGLISQCGWTFVLVAIVVVVVLSNLKTSGWQTWHYRDERVKFRWAFVIYGLILKMMELRSNLNYFIWFYCAQNSNPSNPWICDFR